MLLVITSYPMWCLILSNLYLQDVTWVLHYFLIYIYIAAYLGLIQIGKVIIFIKNVCDICTYIYEFTIVHLLGVFVYPDTYNFVGKVITE